MVTTYNQDVVAWANEQADFLRNKRFDLLDLENIAEEIEDVGKSEKRELANRMAVLLMYLLKWQYQPSHRGKSWELTIKEQRKRILMVLDDVPSLKNSLTDEKWLFGVWADATYSTSKETGLERSKFPENLPWKMEDVLTEGWFPNSFDDNS